MESRERSVAIGIVAPIVLFLFTFAVFFPTLAADFVDLDDFALLLDNTRWRGLSWGHLEWMFTSTLLGHYQPLTWVSFAITYEFAGLDPSAYHFGNVLLHSVNAVLVYFVAMRLVRAAMPDAVRFPVARVRLAAGIGALVWAVHPLRVESVAWVTERRDVLSTMFLLLALLMYLRMVGHRLDRRAGQVGGTGSTGHSEPVSGAKGKWVRLYGWSIGLLVLSLLSKPWGMSFFVVVLILDWYPLRRLPMNPMMWLSRAHRGVVIEKAPFAALGLVFMVSAGMAANSAAMAMRTLGEWPLSSRVAQAAYGLVFYVRKSVVPTDLAVLYELRHGLNPFAPEYLVCYAAVVVVIVLAVVLVRRAPAVLAVVVIYAALVAPVLGFFQSGDQFVADRYSYLAMIGWSILVGAGVALAVRWAEESKRLHGGVIAAGVGALVLTSGVLTMNQSMVWQNSLTLWEHAVKAGAGTPNVRVNYGLNLERMSTTDQRLSEPERQEMRARAIEQFRIAIEQDPGLGKAAFCLGNTLRNMERFEEAAEAFAYAAPRMTQSYQALVNRGAILIKLNRPEEGVVALRAAVLDVETPRTGADARRQLSGVPHLALGSALLQRGDTEGAGQSFRHALRYEDSRGDAEREIKRLGEGR